MSSGKESNTNVRLAVHALAMLSHSRTVSTTQIHEHLTALGFQRTPRSIQRLMDTLSQSFEIERNDDSKPFGYRWKERAAGLGLPMLGDRESLVLLLARQHLEHMLPASVLKALDPMLYEARRRLDPLHGQKPLRSWPRKVAVVSQLQPLIPPKLREGVFEEVTEALQGDFWLDIDYRNLEGEDRKGKRVMPLALVQQGARLFVVCLFEGYEDYRHLALHRIRRAKSSGQPFDRPAFDLQAYIRKGRFGFGDGEEIRLRLNVDRTVAELLQETPVSQDQEIQPARNGHFDLSATVVRSEQLRWWLRTYGAAVRVLEPAGLLDESGPVTTAPVTPGDQCAARPADGQAA